MCGTGTCPCACVCLCLCAQQGMTVVLTCPSPTSSHNKFLFCPSVIKDIDANKVFVRKHGRLSAACLPSEIWFQSSDMASNLRRSSLCCGMKITIAVHCSSFLALLWLVTALRSALWAAASLWLAPWSGWTQCVPSSGQTPACLSPFPTRLVLPLLNKALPKICSGTCQETLLPLGCKPVVM